MYLFHILCTAVHTLPRLQILRRIPQPDRASPGRQGAVAAVAEQASDAACAVVVVYVQPPRLGRVAADGADSALLGEHPGVFVVGDAEIAGAFRGALRLAALRSGSRIAHFASIIRSTSSNADCWSCLTVGSRAALAASLVAAPAAAPAAAAAQAAAPAAALAAAQAAFPAAALAAAQAASLAAAQAAAQDR